MSQKLTLGQSVVKSIFNGLLYPGDRVPVWEAEEVVKMDGGDGCTTL